MGKEVALITGGGGFVGANVIEYFLKHTDMNLICIDSFNHKGDSMRLQKIINSHKDRVRVFTHDLNNEFSDRMIYSFGPIDYILNIASQSHVDRSISDPVPFVKNNVALALTMGELARAVNPKMFLQMSCYDQETRAYTRDGFKNFNEIKVGDKVLSINPKTKNAEWKTVKKVIVQDYEGQMVHFKTNLNDLLVTPNHRMYFESENSLSFLRADESIKNSFRFNYPTASSCTSDYFKVPKQLQKFNLEDLFYLAGLFCGDGFYTKNDKCARVMFRIPIKKKCRQRFEQVLSRMQLGFTIQKNEQIYLKKDVDIYDFFSQFGHRSVNKVLPSWMLDAPKEILQRLYDGLVDTDGSSTEITQKFFTSSDKLMIQFCELAFKLGFHPRVEEMNPRGAMINGRQIKATKNHWRIHLRKAQKFGGREHKITDYSGKIWCLKVEDNKNFLVERNGILSISGNTDECFGPALDGQFHKEWDVEKPSNPYSSSKSCQDNILFSYWRCYGVPIVRTRTMNIFGPMQDAEKFIPMCIKKIFNEEKITIHGTPNRVGSRMYLHVHNLADAWLWILRNIKPQVYQDIDNLDQRYSAFNITGLEEIDNLTLAKTIAEIMNKPLNFEYVDFHSARPGHDRRYALDGTKLLQAGWKHPYSLKETLKHTVEWTLQNPEWLV